MLTNNSLGKIFEFHLNADEPEIFVVGKLVCVDTEWFLVQDISSSGRWNGFALFRQSDLIFVAEETDYLKKLRKLIEYRNKEEPAIPEFNNDLLIDFIKYANNKRILIGMELCSSGHIDIVGIIVSIQEESVLILQYDEYASRDGYVILPLSMITKYTVGDDELDCIQILRIQNGEKTD